MLCCLNISCRTTPAPNRYRRRYQNQVSSRPDHPELCGTPVSVQCTGCAVIPPPNAKAFRVPARRVKEALNGSAFFVRQPNIQWLIVRRPRIVKMLINYRGSNRGVGRVLLRATSQRNALFAQCMRALLPTTRQALRGPAVKVLTSFLWINAIGCGSSRNKKPRLHLFQRELEFNGVNR